MQYLGLSIVIAVVGTALPAVAVDAYTQGVQNVRVEPNENAAPLLTLLPASRVDMKACHDGWCVVEMGETSGWLPEAVLRLRGIAP